MFRLLELIDGTHQHVIEEHLGNEYVGQYKLGEVEAISKEINHWWHSNIKPNQFN